MPAKSVPKRVFFGLRIPLMGRISQLPLIVCPSTGLTEAARTLNQNFIVAGRRLFNVAELKVLDSIFAVQNCFHRAGRSCSVAIAVVSRRPIGDEEPNHYRRKNYARMTI